MSGKMKALLDRMNSLYPKDYRFRDVYMLSVAAEDGDYTPKRASSACRVGSTALKRRNSKERFSSAE